MFFLDCKKLPGSDREIVFGSGRDMWVNEAYCGENILYIIYSIYISITFFLLFGEKVGHPAPPPLYDLQIPEYLG